MKRNMARTGVPSTAAHLLCLLFFSSATSSDADRACSTNAASACYAVKGNPQATPSTILPVCRKLVVFKGTAAAA
jgi:hypothetical protein